MRHFVMIIISFYNMEQCKAGLYFLYLAVPILQFFLIITSTISWSGIYDRVSEHGRIASALYDV